MNNVDERFFETFYWKVNRKTIDGRIEPVLRTGKVIETRGNEGLESYSIFIKSEDNNWQYYAPLDYLEVIKKAVFFDGSEEGE